MRYKKTIRKIRNKLLTSTVYISNVDCEAIQGSDRLDTRRIAQFHGAVRVQHMVIHYLSCVLCNVLQLVNINFEYMLHSTNMAYKLVQTLRFTITMRHTTTTPVLQYTYNPGAARILHGSACFLYLSYLERFPMMCNIMRFQGYHMKCTHTPLPGDNYFDRCQYVSTLKNILKYICLSLVSTFYLDHQEQKSQLRQIHTN